jgi:hypothetical protein
MWEQVCHLLKRGKFQTCRHGRWAEETLVNAPEWLTKRGGMLRQHVDGQSWVVVLNGSPLYSVTPTPVGGKHSCRVVQSNNGKRLDCPTTFATRDEALQGGLEVLRHALGW